MEKYTTLIIYIVTQLLIGIGVVIRLHYADKAKKRELTLVKDNMKRLEAKVDEELKEIKEENASLRMTLAAIQETLVIVRTHTELLILGKIKTANK